jgi:hypothetical protein
VKNTHRQGRELAVLDELAQDKQTLVGRVADLVDDVEDGLQNGLLELKATLLAQTAGTNRTCTESTPGTVRG